MENNWNEMDKRAGEFADKKVGVYLMPDDNATLLSRYFYQTIYKEVATEQKEIDRKVLLEIYHLYSQLIDDLYDAYNNSNWNMGDVTVNGKEEDMAEMLDKLEGMFREALERK